MVPKILVALSKFSEYSEEPKNVLSKTGYDIIINPHKRKLEKPELEALLPGVVGIVSGLEIIDKDIMQNSSLKVISRCGVGMSNIDLDAAKDLNIKVFNTPDAPTQSVAEMTIASLLCLFRKIPEMDLNIKQGRWQRIAGTQLSGKTAAIIGFGRIGRRVAQILNALGAEIIAVDPNIKSDKNFKIADLNTALKSADIISIHASGNKMILGQKEFLMMKKGAYILNPSRGGIVDEGELLKSLECGRIQGAWIDTFTEEPYRGPLSQLDNVILTSHAASHTIECRNRMQLEAVENLIKGLEG